MFSDLYQDHCKGQFQPINLYLSLLCHLRSVLTMVCQDISNLKAHFHLVHDALHSSLQTD